MNRISIRHKILLLLVLTSFLSIVIIGGVSLYAGTKALKIETIEKTSYVLDSMKIDFEKNITDADNVLKALERVTFEYLDPQKINDTEYLKRFIDNITPTFQREAQNHTKSQTAYIYINPSLTHEVFDCYFADQDMDGEVERQASIPITYFESGPSEDDSKSWWFGPVESKKAFWTEPYYWTLDNDNTIQFVSYTKPIYSGDALFAVIGTDMTYENIKSRLVSYNEQKFGVSFILDGNDEMVIDKTLNNDWTLDSDSISKAMTNGYTEIETENGDRLVFLKPLSNGWSIGIEMEESSIYKKLFRYTFLIVSAMVLSQLIFIFLSVRLSNYITDPIIDIMLAIKASHNSDYALTITPRVTERGDEIGLLGRALDHMSSEIQTYIGTMNKQSEEILREMNLRKDVENKLYLIMRILEHSDNGVFVLNEAYKIVYANKTFSEITGYEVENGVSTLSSCGIYLTQSQMTQLNRENALQDEIEQLKSSGKVYPMHLYMTRIIESEIYYLGLFKDLTEAKIRDQKLDYLKFYDPLTRLPNRILFMDLTEKQIKDAADANFEYIVINIDNFRLLNAVLGKVNCDKIIIDMSKRLRKLTLKAYILARTEGDEFSIIHHVDNDDDAEEILKDIRNQLSKPYYIDDEDIYITVSMGVSTFPESGIDISTLVKNANIALNQVKANGKNQTLHYGKVINEISSENYTLLKGLRYALERNEMTLNYQPQIDSLTNEIVGLEALIRWHYQGDWISPDRFIPLAEETRMIIPIGEFVISEALSFLKELQKKRVMIPISINISVEQLKFELIYDYLKSQIEKYKIDPKLIKLEITESIIITGQEESIAVINKLTELGVKIAIDDFGMGYSSLSYLKRFKFNQIKLDRIFIKDFPETDDGHIATLIIQLANSLNVEIVAEGVETIEQRDFLIKNGCNVIQGYYYSKPLSKENCHKFITNS